MDLLKEQIAQNRTKVINWLSVLGYIPRLCAQKKAQ